MTTEKNELKASAVVSLPEDISLFSVFEEDHDRFSFPGPVYRVSGGHGGEALLIAGSQKTALLDCGIDRLAGLVVTDRAGMAEHVRADRRGNPYGYGKSFLSKKD